VVCGWRRMADVDSGTLALRLTLLALLLHPVGGEPIRPLILVLAGAGLLFPALLRRPSLWGALALLTGIRVVLDWPLSDNHAYLLSYWCLAIAISCRVEDRDRVLALNARWLIALVFGFATLWKLAISPDFMNGTFFRVTLLADPRFEGFTRLVGGLSMDQIEAARVALGRHADTRTLEAVAAATPSPRLEWLAFAITRWTVAIEGAVFVAFCWPSGRGPSKLRNALLIVFCATTYAVATVDGFGWILVAMGIAGCEIERRGTRVALLATFVLIFFYREVPWLSWLADFVAHTS
jgi:hypothetical protein